MDDAKWERATGAGGIVFVVLVVISALLPGKPPTANDEASKVVKYFVDNLDEIRIASFLGLVAILFIVWWAAAVFRMTERATGNVRLGVMVAMGIAIAAVGAAVSSVIFATVAIRGVAGTGGAAEMRFYYLLGSSMNAIVAIGSALVVGATSAAILRTGMLPRWLGWFGAVVAVLAVASTPMSVSTNDVFMAVSLAGFVTFGIWVLIVSILMVRPAAPAAASSEPEPEPEPEPAAA